MRSYRHLTDFNLCCRLGDPAEDGCSLGARQLPIGEGTWAAQGNFSSGRQMEDGAKFLLQLTAQVGTKERGKRQTGKLEAPRFCWSRAGRSSSPTAGSPRHGRGPGTHSDPTRGTWAHRVRASRQLGARETPLLPRRVGNNQTAIISLTNCSSLDCNSDAEETAASHFLK